MSERLSISSSHNGIWKNGRLGEEQDAAFVVLGKSVADMFGYGLIGDV